MRRALAILLAVFEPRCGAAEHAARPPLSASCPPPRSESPRRADVAEPPAWRRGRGIVLTESGRYFATKATAILGHVASVLADSKRWR